MCFTFSKVTRIDNQVLVRVNQANWGLEQCFR